MPAGRLATKLILAKVVIGVTENEKLTLPFPRNGSRKKEVLNVFITSSAG